MLVAHCHQWHCQNPRNWLHHCCHQYMPLIIGTFVHTFAQVMGACTCMCVREHFARVHVCERTRMHMAPQPLRVRGNSIKSSTWPP